MSNDSNIDTIVLGAGCFWCVEAIFQKVDGVVEVIPGYCNGQSKNPTYNEVCSGTTGHAEVARILYDSSIVSFKYLLEVFWKTHDPTTLNRQGNDIGTQYRSAIFCLNNSQLDLANEYKLNLDKENIWDSPIVTEIETLDVFYPAENYHHNYYNNNKSQGYCRFIIQPKLEKFTKVFGTLDNLK
jgi:peptide-methionine (S)-S-oxide reductase